LAEASLTLRADPASLVCIEVNRANLADVLTWLPDAMARHPRARAVALVGAESPHGGRLEIFTAALLEAGFVEIATSPRRLRHILDLGRRYQLEAAQYQAAIDAQMSYTQRVWASLPWQADSAPLG
jgi:hypothetical protein